MNEFQFRMPLIVAEHLLQTASRIQGYGTSRLVEFLVGPCGGFALMKMCHRKQMKDGQIQPEAG